VTVFTYIIEHDLGFAPNPFHGVCTLACCKPRIRKRAQLGDLILGTGAVKPKLRGHLTFWMCVDEVLTFDDYWGDPRFQRKKPVMQGTTYLRYGDNIYHHAGGETFQQDDSFHSREDGSVSPGDLQRDTGMTDRVLVGRDFAYWGTRGIPLPDTLKCFVKREMHNFSDEQVAELLAWLSQRPERGYLGEPAHWQFLEKRKRKAKVEEAT